jgi:hypothetical protein
MGYRIKGSAILALTLLTPVASSQEAIRREEPHPEPRIHPDPHAPDPSKVKLAKNAFDAATRARLQGDWGSVHRLLNPVSPSVRVPEPFESKKARTPVALEPDPESMPASAKKLYGQVGTWLAEQALNAGDPRAAVPFFTNAFTFAPPQSAETGEHFKKALFDATDLSYRQHDWNAALTYCSTIEQTQYFPVAPAEREMISLVALRSENWLQAGRLPGDTLVVDHIETGTGGSYFQVFGSGGTVDILVKAPTISGLLAHPDFQAVRGALAQGADMVLTPAITRVPGWENALRRGLPQTTFWSDPYISDAAESLAALQQTKLLPSDVDLAILVPKNADQQTAMGLHWTDAQRDHAWQSGESLKLNPRGAAVITQSVNRTGLTGWATDLWGTDSKKAMLDSLRNRKGVIILFAHGDRDGVYTPEGKKLTVQDVQGLDLHANHPIVLLLSCEGNARGESPAGSSLAQALKKSGATAVWSYGQKVDAGEAANAAAQFLDLIRSGKSPLETFRSMSRDAAIKAGPLVHLKVSLQGHGNASGPEELI